MFLPNRYKNITYLDKQWYNLEHNIKSNINITNFGITYLDTFLKPKTCENILHEEDHITKVIKSVFYEEKKFAGFYYYIDFKFKKYIKYNPAFKNFFKIGEFILIQKTNLNLHVLSLSGSCFYKKKFNDIIIDIKYLSAINKYIILCKNIGYIIKNVCYFLNDPLGYCVFIKCKDAECEDDFVINYDYPNVSFSVNETIIFYIYKKNIFACELVGDCRIAKSDRIEDLNENTTINYSNEILNVKLFQ